MNRAGQVRQQAPETRPATGRLLQRKCACGKRTVGGGECPECAKKKRQLQRKLAIGASHDPLEHEADRIADQVMRMPSHSSIARAQLPIQRLSGHSGGQGETAPPSVEQVLSSPGSPLEPGLRQDMEQRFGYDFSQVRVHTGRAAELSAKNVNALAYTVGRNIVFGEGQYPPGTKKGKFLVAHELTHLLQQNERDMLVQRACGPSEIGSVGGCIGRSGDITDFGGSSDRIFLFNVGCDDFQIGEEARLRRIVRRDILPTDIVEIDGFASEEGEPIFNDNLSCARAKAAALVINSETSIRSNLFKHGATPGTRVDRRSVVISIISPTMTVETPSTSRHEEECADFFGSCEFYRCRERKHPCGNQGYYEGYGYKYCERFSQTTRSTMTTAGRDWVDCTLLCLQRYIHNNITENSSCNIVRERAFDSHSDCYVRCGVCSLPPGDLDRIMNTIDSDDFDLWEAFETVFSGCGLFMFPPSPPSTRGFQIECVMRLGGCSETRPAGIPTRREIIRYNQQCRRETGYRGRDVFPSNEDCRRYFSR